MISEEAAKRRPAWARLPAREVDLAAGYALWSTQYDAEANELLGPEAAALEQLLAPLSWTRGLDAASGTGRHLARLAVGQATIVALDQSPKMLERSRSRCRREAVSAHHVQGDLGSLPFPAHEFDLAVCALALCHVPDLGSTFAELARVLRLGGHLVLTDFHPDAVAWGFRSEFAQNGLHYRLPNPGHSRDDYLQALAASGFTSLAVIETTHGEAGAQRPHDMPPRYFDEFDGLRFLFAGRAQNSSP